MNKKYFNIMKKYNDWSRVEIIDSIQQLNNNIDYNLIKKLHNNDLKRHFLQLEYANGKIKYFSINKLRAELITNDELLNIIQVNKDYKKQNQIRLQRKTKEEQKKLYYQKMIKKTKYKRLDVFIKNIESGKIQLGGL